MNIVFKVPDKDSEDTFACRLSNYKGFPLLIFLLSIFSLIAGTFLLINLLSKGHTSSDVSIEVSGLQNSSVIEIVSKSYGIPVDYMTGLAGYIALNKDKFTGQGLFAVRSGDLGWIQDKVLLETNVNLEDVTQNAQIAAYLIKRFYDSGYSWKESFLIYAFGFPAIHGSEHQDFIDFIGFNVVSGWDLR